jgi:enterochelin esterase-like enzyme
MKTDANPTPRAEKEPRTGMSEKDQAAFTPGDEPYSLGPDSQPQQGIPPGAITQYHWVSERIYPGTERDYWLYVPQQYDPAQPACLMVFQDGKSYLSSNIRAQTVFDNLIQCGEMPVTIGLFVSPGDRGPGNPLYGGTNTTRWATAMRAS